MAAVTAARPVSPGAWLWLCAPEWQERDTDLLAVYLLLSGISDSSSDAVSVVAIDTMLPPTLLWTLAAAVAAVARGMGKRAG